MPSLIKQHILKPLSIFAKNLNFDQIKLSALKGEVNMNNLELNEEIFMELIGFPKWLRLNSAVCAYVSIKIPWTNLRSRSIFMVIDTVTIEVEVLEKPRNSYNGGLIPGYRPSSGHSYGLADRVLDGISMRIHELVINLKSSVFKVSVNLSHIFLSNKKPNWESGPLNSTFLHLPARNCILIFKEISWESTHFVADGLDDRMTPVKVITNRAYLRVTLKKQLSDASLACAKLDLIVESLLWVLTVSQLEATIVFLKSIKESMQLSADLKKQHATKQMSSGLGSYASMVPPDVPPSQYAIGRTIDPRLMKAFEFYDLRENSFHLQVHLIETHFCEDTLRKTLMTTQLVSGGSVRLTLKNFNFDHYPAHPKTSPRTKWSNYSEINQNRTKWLQSLKPNSDPDFMIDRRLESTQVAIYEEVVVFRLQDLTVSCVMLENQVDDERWPLPATITGTHKKRTIFKAFDGEQRSLISNTLFASDTEMHKLPLNSSLISIDLTQDFSFDAVDAVLPTIFYMQVQPLHLKFDVDTMIWLNAFFLNLTINLKSLFDERKEPTRQQTANHLFCRAEILMPRVIFPMYSRPSELLTCSSSDYPWTGPSALVVQIDTVILQALPKPLTVQMARALAESLDNLEKQVNPPPAWGRDHAPPDLPQFRRFTQPEAQITSCEVGTNGLLVCIHCPSVWAEFLTICEAAKREPTALPTFKTYRQAFFDPYPLTCWTLIPSWPLWYRPPSTSRVPIVWTPELSRHLTSPPPFPAPISILVDLDSPVNPLSIFTTTSTLRYSSSKPKPLHFIIGHSGAVFTFRSVQRLRLPDAVDHLIFLYGLAFRLTRLQASMSLDYMRIMARKESNGDAKLFHEWLMTFKCLLTHGVKVELASTVESRFIDPPMAYEGYDNVIDVSITTRSSLKTDLEQALMHKEAGVNLIQSPDIDCGKNPSSFEQISNFSSTLQFPKIQGSSNFTNSSSLLDVSSCAFVDSQHSVHDDTSTISRFDSFEILLPDDEAFSEMFTNSFDDLIPEEIGIDVANSAEELEEKEVERSITIVDEKQALNFPPWLVQRLVMDLKGLSVDADITTVEARLWFGVGSVDFFDPDDVEEDSSDSTGITSDCLDTSPKSPAFLITLRFGGDAIPGQQKDLQSKYDGWMAMHVRMLRETTLYPVPITWDVIEALLGHLTSRGGVRACNRVATTGLGAGSMPWHSPPQLLDLTFFLERGHLVLDLTSKPRRWGRRSRRDTAEMPKRADAPIRKVKLLQGFSASLNSEGVLELSGAIPSFCFSTGPTPPITTTTTASSQITPPPLPRSRPLPSPSRYCGPVLPNSGVSMAEENAKLRLMVERLNAQVLSLTMDLTKLKTMYPT